MGKENAVSLAETEEPGVFSFGAGMFGKIILSAVLLFCAPALFSLDASFTGTYKSFLLGLYDPAYNEDLYGYSQNTLRLDARIYPNRNSLVELAYEISPRLRSTDNAGGGLFGGAGGNFFSSASGENGNYRVVDFDERAYPLEDDDEKNLGLYHNLDRAYGVVYLPFGDLFLGRQAISWGSAHILNPTDILAPYGFNSLDTERKRGIDAARLRMPVGSFSEIDLGYVAGDSFSHDESTFFARFKGYALETDFSLLAMDFKENLLIGLDATRSVGGAGVWLEGAYVLPDTFASLSGSGTSSGDSSGLLSPDTEDQYLTVTAGADYNFGPKLYGYAEYHYNGPGKSAANKYDDLAASMAKAPEEEIAYTEGAVSLFGKHYLGLGATYKLSPLFPLSSLLLLNIGDLSTYLSLSGEYNFTENVYIEGGAYLGLGNDPHIDKNSSQEYKSEFGAYPNMFYLSMKIYF